MIFTETKILVHFYTKFQDIVIIFHDFPWPWLLSMTFQAWKMVLLNSTTFQEEWSPCVDSYTLSTQYWSSSPNVTAFWDAVFDFASSPRTPSVRSWSSRPTDELSSLNAVSNQRVRSRIRNIESRSRSRSRSNSRSLSAEIQRTTSSDAVYHLTHMHHSCNLYTLERCNPWPHVAHRHMSISKLLSTCC